MRKRLSTVLRATSSLLAFLMTFTVIMGNSLSAKAIDSVICISSEKEEVLPGETFDITISVDGADALAGFLIYVYGDTDVFSAEIDQEDGMIRVQKGTLTSKGTLIANDHADKGWQVLWFSTDNVSGHGTLFTLTLVADEHIQSGDYRFNVGYSQENTVDVDSNLQIFGTQDLVIQVPGNSPPRG